MTALGGVLDALFECEGLSAADGKIRDDAYELLTSLESDDEIQNV